MHNQRFVRYNLFQINKSLYLSIKYFGMISNYINPLSYIPDMHIYRAMYNINYLSLFTYIKS